MKKNLFKLAAIATTMALFATSCSNDSVFDDYESSNSAAFAADTEVRDVASQITFLSVWHNKQTQAIYVCVKKATGSNDQGILLSLENKGTRPDDQNYASTDAIDALARCQIERPNDYEKMLDFMKALSYTDYKFKYARFANFRRIYYSINSSDEIRPDGQLTTRIMSKKGGKKCQSWFYKRKMPEHKGVTEKNYIESYEIKFTPSTRLDDREWECLMH